MKQLLSLLLACATCQAKSIVTDELLHKVAIIESNLNTNAVGDNGDSLGAFQIGRRAWADAVAYSQVTADHTEQYVLPSDWKNWAKDYDVAHKAATLILLMHEERMIKNRIKPTELKLYMAYNMGYQGARFCNFDINSTSGFRKAVLTRARLILSR